MSTEQTPLTPEERDLAQRLARLDAGAQPSAALDAGILAAARAAASGAAGSGGTTTTGRGTVAPHGRRPRLGWAAGAGLAASVVLAVGIAWQLRPLPETAVEYSEAPAAAPAAPPERALRAVAPPEKPMPAEAGTREAAADPAPAAMREVAPASPAPPPPATASEEPPVMFDDPSPVDTRAPPPPPAAAPAPRAAPLATTGEAARAQVGAEAARRGEEAARQESRVGVAADSVQGVEHERPSLDRVEVTGSRLRKAQGAAAATAADADAAAEADAAAAEPWFDQPLDDAPPASADSPQVREAWLSRIRELVAEERYDEARASLGEFHHRYPDVAIPQDLRVLLTE